MICGACFLCGKRSPVISISWYRKVATLTAVAGSRNTVPRMRRQYAGELWDNPERQIALSRDAGKVRQSTENGLPARLIMPPDLTAAFDLSASGCEVRPPSERKKAQEKLLPRETAGDPLYPHPEGAAV